MKKIFVFGAFLALAGAILVIDNKNTKAYEKKRKEDVKIYIKCLYDNFGQRYDCARLQGQHYKVLDQKAKEEGYTFTIDEHHNLIIHKGE